MITLSKRGKLPSTMGTNRCTGAERREYIEAQIKIMGLEAAKEYFSFSNLVHNNIVSVMGAEAWASSFNAVYKKYKPVKKVKKQNSKAALIKHMQKGLVRQMPMELLNSLADEFGSIEAFDKEMARELAYERRNMD